MISVSQASLPKQKCELNLDNVHTFAEFGTVTVSCENTHIYTHARTQSRTHIHTNAHMHARTHAHMHARTYPLPINQTFKTIVCTN